MGKYEPLADHLRKLGYGQVRMKFEEIEKVLGFPLPPSSRKHRAWWSNNPSNNVMTHAWIDAGYQTEAVDMEQRKLVFHRVAPKAPPLAPDAPPEAATGGAPEVAKRRSSRRWLGSKSVRPWTVARLSQTKRSPGRHLWV